MLRSLLSLFALGLGAVTTHAANVTLDLTLGWQKQPLSVPSRPQISARGQSVRITRVSGLISEIALQRADGTSVQLPGQFGYFDAVDGPRTVELTGVPAGDYTGLHFRVGVGAQVNHSDPSTWPAEHPLNPLVNHLHWGWQGGYVFLAIEGYATDGDHETGFSFHLATDTLAMPVNFTSPYSITGDTRITLLLDLADLLGDLRISEADGTTSTHSRTGDPLAARLANAVGPAFWFGAATAARTSPGNAPPAIATADTASPAPLPFNVPPGWPQPELPADNAPTTAGVALGETLFRDRRLSAHSVQSCATCHAPDSAFSDHVALSSGADGAPGLRNAMPLLNLAWHPDYAWDGSKPRIRDQAIAALTNPIEMHGDPAAVVAALAADATLAPAFAATFGDTEVTLDRIGRALEQYLLMQVSADSKLDRALRGEDQLTTEEQRGLTLFNTEYDPRRGQYGADCFHCHGGPLFSDFTLKNNGLDLVSTDPGRAQVSGADTDRGKFKTPSLRNVAVTAPYMHDGRITTLEDAVGHYVDGVERTANLDPNLAKHPGAGVPLSDEDQAALVAFLRTLTDPRFASSHD